MHKLQLKYFVLKPEGNDIFAKASREAMQKYSEIIDKEYPEFALEIRQHLLEITKES